MNAAYNITLVICLIISILIFISGKVKPHIRAIAILMLVTAIVEIGSHYIIFPTFHKSNHWVFNVATIFEFYFFSYFFACILNHSATKKLIQIFVLDYPLILIISFLTIQKWHTFHTYTYILGELYLVILCLLYFRELYTNNDFKKLSTSPEFWIVTGLLIFTVGNIPYMILFNYLNTHYIIVSNFFKDYILTALNIVMYTMFSIGLLWSTRTQK